MAFYASCILCSLFLASLANGQVDQTTTAITVVKRYPYMGDYTDMRPAMERNGTVLIADGILCVMLQLPNGESTANFDVTMTEESNKFVTASPFFTFNMQCAEIPPHSKWNVVITQPNNAKFDAISFAVATIGQLAYSLSIESVSGQRILGGDPFSFMWSFGFGTDPSFACVLVVYGDNGPSDSFGPTTICQTWARLDEEALVRHQSDKSVLSTPLQHMYAKPGVYAMAVFAYNSLTNGSASLIVQVDDPLPCFPIVSLLESSSNIDAPLVRYRNQDIRFTVRVTVPSCDQAYPIPAFVKQWSVFRIHMQNRAVVDPVPQNLTSFYRQDEELRFQPFALPLGTYKVVFSVFLPSGQARTVFTYFRITQRPLIAMIYRKQSSLSLGLDQSVRLSAQSLSANPNELGNNQSALFDRFSWSCRLLAAGNASCTGNQSCAATESQSSCFQPASAKLRLDRGSLVLKGSDFTVHGKYEVGVTVMKMYSWDGGYSIANLSAMSNLEVTIVAAKIAPNITADCGLPQFCVWNGDGIRITTDYGLNLNATCWDCKESDQKFQWTYAVVFPNETIVRFDRDGSGINGMKSRYLSVSPSFFASYDTEAVFQAEVTYMNDNSAYGAKVKVYMNMPPENGTCKLSPVNGIAIETSFVIQCNDWSDSDGIGHYSFYYREAWTTDDWDLIGLSHTPWITVSFPPGYYEVLAIISDNLGAKSTFRLDGTVSISPISLASFDPWKMMKQLSASQNDPVRVSGSIRALLASFAEKSKWNDERLMPLKISDQSSSAGTEAISEFLSVDIPKLMDAVFASNLSLVHGNVNGRPLIPVPMIDDLATDVLIRDFLRSTPGHELLTMLSQMINDSYQVIGPESKDMPFGYDLFIDAFGSANISTNVTAAMRLMSASPVLKPLFGEDVFGLVIFDEQTALDQAIIVIPDNVSDFLLKRISSLADEYPTDSVGKLLILEQNGPMAIEIRSDTVAVKFVTLTGGAQASVVLPVQISWYGVASIVGRHAASINGTSMLHKLPGASKWLEMATVSAKVVDLRLLHLPLGERAADALFSGNLISRNDLQIPDVALSTLKERVLQEIQAMTDVLNDAVSKVYSTVLATLSGLTIESTREAGPVMETLIDLLDASIKTAIDSSQLALVPQTVIDLTSMEAIAGIINRFRTLFQLELESITPGEASEISSRLLRLVTAMNKVLVVSAQTPLMSDRLSSYESELKFFDTLSMEYRGSSDSTQSDKGMPARRRAQEIGKKMAEDQLRSLLEMITVLLSRDKVGLMTGTNVTVNEAGAHLLFISGPTSDLFGRNYSFSDGSSLHSIQFPGDLCDMVSFNEPQRCDANQTIVLRMIYLPLDAIKGANDQVTSGTLDVTILNPETGDPIPVTHSVTPILLRFQPSVPEEQSGPEHRHDLTARDLMNVHEVKLPQADGAVVISFRLDDVLPEGAQMVLYLKRGTFPGPWPGDYDALATVSADYWQNVFKWSISSEDITKYGGAGNYYIGVAFVSNETINGTTATVGGRIFYYGGPMPMYALAATAKYCFYYEPHSKNWLTDGCRVSSDISDAVECSCTHTTLFAAGLVPLSVQPASQIVLSKISSEVNLSVYVTMVVLSCAYVLLSVWAKIRDRADVKAHRLVAWDAMRQRYEVTVTMDIIADISSKFQMSYGLIGTQGESDVYSVAVKPSKSCKFGFDCDRSLGQLVCICLWQEANGAYFRVLVRNVVVSDIRAGTQYAFEGEQCLATSVEVHETIFSLAPVTPEAESFHYPRLHALLNKIVEEHLCFSIFLRTQRSRMSRVQRLSCFVSLLLTGMVLVTLWHTLMPSRHIPTTTFGPFVVTWEQVTVGVLANILAVPPHILIVELLKRSKKRRRSAQKYAIDQTSPNLEEAEDKLWPWWCRVLGYMLLALTICGSALGIVLLGMQYPDERARRWLSSSLATFLTSLLVTQPLEIIAISMCVAKRKNQPDAAFTASSRATKPPSPTDSAITPTKRLLSFAFLILVMWTAYNDRTIDTYRLKSHLEKLFIEQEFLKISNADHFWNWMNSRFLPSLRAEWYNGQRPTELNGFLSDKTTKIIGAVALRQVRIRPNSCNQDRSSALSPCKVDGRSTEDTLSYGPGWSPPNKFEAEREEYQFRHSSALKTTGQIDIYSAGGYVFVLSPYPMHESDPEYVNFTTALMKLRQERWLDRRTKALIIDLCAYNYQSDIFAVLQFLFESSISGDSLVPSYDIRPLRFTDREMEKDCFFVHWTSESVFVICMILYFFRQLWNILYQGAKHYFSDLWTIVELAIMTGSISVIVYYFLRLEAADDFFAQLRKNYKVTETCGQLRYVAEMDTSLNTCLALVVFCATLKIIHVLKITSITGLVIRRMAGQLAGFTVLLAVVYFWFVGFLYLALNNRGSPSADFVTSLTYAFGIISGKGAVKEIFGESPFTVWAAVVFTFIHIMILTKLATSIALSTYRTVRTSSIAEGNTIVTMFEHAFSKVSRQVLGMAPDRTQDFSQEIRDAKNVLFLEQRVDDLLNRVENLFWDEQENAKLIDSIIAAAKQNWDEVMEIGVEEEVGPVPDRDAPESEMTWVIEQDNMFRIE